jgi:hypothetical protein
LSSGDMNTQYRCIVVYYAQVYTSVNVSMLQYSQGRHADDSDPARWSCEIVRGVWPSPRCT